jgi:hypothetical protein|tara:strand:+ start:378 stop:668 length:291 start_codon:yes stop_codon:yes gene_type:complete
MSQLNDSVAELANFWDDLHREDANLTLKFEELLGTEKSEQLQAYIQELENYNDEVDVDGLINEMEEARYQLDNLESAVQDALNAIDNAVSEAEDLR